MERQTIASEKRKWPEQSNRWLVIALQLDQTVNSFDIILGRKRS